LAIYKDAVGVEVVLATGQDLTEATKLEIHVTKPDGTTATWTATRHATAGSIKYITQSTDLSQTGFYVMVSYVEWGSSKHIGDASTLRVFEPGFDLATYQSNPAGRKIDAVRLELGKDTSLTYLTDSEIEYCLIQGSNNVLMAASFAADKVAGLLTDLCDKSMGGSSVSLHQKSESWRQKAQDLLNRARNPSVTPRFSSSTRRTMRFSVGQHDYVPPGCL
jgi:hypothetical protein